MLSPQPTALPLPSPDEPSPLLTPKRLRQWTLAFVLLGLAARCLRYFLRFPLWEDECFLCVNLADRGYAGLMESLDYHQVAPAPFLWLQLTIVKVFGFDEMSLRLVSFLAGVGGLLLFWRLAGQCLTGLAQLLAVALFSVTYAMIRYSAEAKPYGVDLFVALVLTSCLVNWLKQPESNRWLWILTAATPLCVALSYGAILLGGGLSLAAAYIICRRGQWRGAKAWLAFNLVLVLSFVGQYFLGMRAQMAGELASMRDMWNHHFPPLNDIGRFLFWLVQTHTSELLAYPAGGRPFLSVIPCLCWVIGLVALARRRQFDFLLLCLAPLAVTLVAAALRRYPYGGHTRLNIYVAPFMCLVIGYGGSALLAWCGRRQWALAPRFALIVLAAVGGVSIARDLVFPYKAVSDIRARAFAQWFWYNAAYDAEVACLRNDLGRNFTPKMSRELNYSAEYFCNQRIYSDRHARRAPLAWERISADHPLRCVIYRVHNLPFDDGAYDAWLTEMQKTYALSGRDRFPMVRQNRIGRIIGTDHLEVLRFVPASASPAAKRVTGSL